jgi:apolipoprotein N-acyltransferase
MNPKRPLRWLHASIAALTAGSLHALSLSISHAWWLQLLTLAVLAYVTAGETARRAAWLAWMFSTAWLTSGLWWLFISMHQFGNLPPVLAAAAVLLLAAALSIYYALAFALWARLRPSAGGFGGVLFQALSWSACWLLAELARATLLTGFPWIASGYAHVSGPLSAWAPWVGVYGLCALAALVAFSMATWVHVPVCRRHAALLSGIGLGILALGMWLPCQFTRSTGTLTVSLLQTNVAQDLKFDPSYMGANLLALTEQVHSAKGQLVLTPESVVPLSYDDLSIDFWQELQRPFTDAPRGALVGIFLRNAQGGYVNSMVGFSKQADQYHYGKRHLLPFGEVIPPGFGWFVRMMNIPISDQARGQSTAPFEVAGQRIRPLICFEDLFGEDMADSMVGPGAATVLANASNLAWFGHLMVQDQHLMFSQMRALEFQRPVVRATNTGSTAVVDHRGEVVARLPALTRETLESQVEGQTGETPYARWLSRLGLWPLWLTAVVGLLAPWAGRRLQRRVRPHA